MDLASAWTPQTWISLGLAVVAVGSLVIAAFAMIAANRSATIAQSIADRTDVDWKIRRGRFQPVLFNAGRDPAFTVVVKVDGAVVATIAKAYGRMPATELPPAMLVTVDVTWHPRPNGGGDQLFWSGPYPP
jgi:hypothetical protein